MLRGPRLFGFNGVTTWCRAGLAIAADAAPLGEPRLDMLGRCVKVELAKFIVFNVYAPQSGNPGGVSLQMQSLSLFGERPFGRTLKRKSTSLFVVISMPTTMQGIYTGLAGVCASTA